MVFHCVHGSLQQFNTKESHLFPYVIKMDLYFPMNRTMNGVNFGTKVLPIIANDSQGFHPCGLRQKNIRKVRKFIIIPREALVVFPSAHMRLISQLGHDLFGFLKCCLGRVELTTCH